MNSNNNQNDMILKIVFVGDSGVGKTSLLRRQAEDTFTQEHIATIGVDFRIKIYRSGKITAKVQLWDTAGQERFRSIQKPYYKNASMICLCFDLSNRTSFNNLPHWLDQIKNFDVTGQVYLVGCKSDLDSVVPTDQILTFAQAYKVNYAQTSAKDNIGISDFFQRIVSESIQTNLIKLAYQKPLQKDNTLIQNVPNRKKTCC